MCGILDVFIFIINVTVSFFLNFLSNAFLGFSQIPMYCVFYKSFRKNSFLTNTFLYNFIHASFICESSLISSSTMGVLMSSTSFTSMGFKHFNTTKHLILPQTVSAKHQKLISTTILPIYSTSTPLPRNYQTITILPAVYTTPFITRQQQPRPFTKIVQNLEPAIVYQTTNRNYNYYDEETDKIISELSLQSRKHKVLVQNSGIIKCLDQGNFPHPASCRKFISCARIDNGDILGWEYTCPKNLSFDPVGGICNWSAGLGCGS